MRKEKHAEKEFLFPWIRGICASSSSWLAEWGQAPPGSASPNNGRAMPSCTRAESRGRAFSAPF